MRPVSPLDTAVPIGFHICADKQNDEIYSCLWMPSTFLFRSHCFPAMTANRWWISVVSRRPVTQGIRTDCRCTSRFGWEDCCVSAGFDQKTFGDPRFRDCKASVRSVAARTHCRFVQVTRHRSHVPPVRSAAHAILCISVVSERYYPKRGLVQPFQRMAAFGCKSSYQHGINICIFRAFPPLASYVVSTWIIHGSAPNAPHRHLSTVILWDADAHLSLSHIRNLLLSCILIPQFQTSRFPQSFFHFRDYLIRNYLW